MHRFIRSVKDQQDRSRQYLLGEIFFFFDISLIFRIPTQYDRTRTRVRARALFSRRHDIEIAKKKSNTNLIKRKCALAGTLSRLTVENAMQCVIINTHSVVCCR